MNLIKKTLMLLILFTATGTEAQVPCDATNSPTFQLTTNQYTLTTNGICGMEINIQNANTTPFGGAVSFGIITPAAPTVTVIIQPAPQVFLAAGIYTFLVKDDMNNCTTSQTVLVTVLQGPMISVVASNTPICSGRTTTLTASGATSYTWDTNATTPSITVIPTTTITYGVIGTGTNVCANTGYFVLNVNPSPNVTATVNPNPVCVNEPITLTASGANVYTWNTSQTGASITATPLVTSNYTVTGTNEYGCETSRQVLVTVLPCTSVEEFKNESKNFKIFPNPADGFIELRISNLNLLKEIKSISIYTSVGQLIREEEFSLKIKTNDLPSGFYFLKLNGNQGTVSKRFVIAR